MKKLFLHIIFLSLVSLAGNPLGAQQLVPELGPVFVDTVVPRVDILIPQDSLDLILAPGNEESNQHFLATFIFDNGQIRDTLQEVGFRLRGNTSRHSAKKSFKVSFNTFVRGREYHGLEKLNLNGEHNDPSIIRSKLCWDLFRQAGIPAPRANHVKLYINGSYKGLYINVEHIDEEFVRDRFGNREGNLYKCTYPADLDFISNNPNDYRYETFGKRPYELHTNTDEDDYSDLAEFIQVLNQTPLSQLPCELEKVFNVHRYLKTLAVELLCGHWDNYAFLKNNFYLYHNAATGQFEYIPYDTDNTFGIDWFGNNWATRDLYNWSMPGEPRPLYTRLLDVPAYRAEFSFYVRQLTPALYSPASMFDRIDSLRDMIASSAQYDVFRTLDYGYNYQDFLDSYDQALGAHVTDGLKPFITTRSNTALSQVEISNMRPAVSEVKVDARGMPIFFQALIEDEVPDSLTVTLHFRLDSSAWQSTPMFDDGNHQDGQAQDGIWGGGIQFAVPSATIQYKIEARDKQAQTGVAPPCQALVLHYHPPVPNLVINEVMARNDQWAVDEYGEWEDWIEIYNADTLPVYLGDKWLTDDPALRDRWLLPKDTLYPDQYALFWADRQNWQGEAHTNFKLSGDGEFVGLFASRNDNLTPIDTFRFPALSQNQSYGRFPNGIGSLQVLPFATPGANNNDPLSVEPESEEKWQIYPNPFENYLTIEWEEWRKVEIQLMDVQGRVWQRAETLGNQLSLNTKGLTSGLYLLMIKKEDQPAVSRKLIRLKN